MPKTIVESELNLTAIMDEIGTVEFEIAVDMSEPDDYRGYIEDMDKFRNECHDLARKFFAACVKQASTLAVNDPKGDIAQFALAQMQGGEADRRYDEARDRGDLDEALEQFRADKAGEIEG